MKAGDIAALKQLSRNVVSAIPGNLTMNANGQLFVDGERIELLRVLAHIDVITEHAIALDKIIQGLEARKTAGK